MPVSTEDQEQSKKLASEAPDAGVEAMEQLVSKMNRRNHGSIEITVREHSIHGSIVHESTLTLQLVWGEDGRVEARGEASAESEVLAMLRRSGFDL